ncbi:DNA methyltransferase, partial [Thermococcus sp.]|uniref:DNA methyltransferase n=1 Tax=Thermococcus sp. TaxID=35749 RepID=UPI002609DE80
MLTSTSSARGFDAKGFNKGFKFPEYYWRRARREAMRMKNTQALIDIMVWITEGEYTSNELKLFEDAKQLYELQLAKMEFLNFSTDLDEFIKRAAYFEEVLGKKSWHYYISSVKGKGQIGHTNQYITHWFYPYKGKFHGQMVKALINFANARNSDVVLDPYLGSGTTLIESSLLGLPGKGVEINPALAIISQIKLDSLGISYPELSKMLTPTLLNEAFKYFKNLKVHPNSIKPTVEEHLNARELLELLWDSYFPRSPLHELPFEWRNFLMLVYLHALSDYTYLKGTRKEKSLQEFFHEDLQEYLKTIEGTY